MCVCECVSACVTGWGGAGEAGGSHRSLPPPAATLPGQRVARGVPWLDSSPLLLAPRGASRSCVARTSGNRRRCPRSSAMATDVPEVAFPLTSAILSPLRPHHCHGPSVVVVSRAVTTNPQALGWIDKKKKTVLIF